jgi:hypothetical protein
MADVLSGRRPVHLLEAAMTTSDFPLLFGDVLDRQLLARYQAVTPTWPRYIRRGTVRDFRQAKRFAVDGLESTLEDVEERAPYPADDLDESEDLISVRKVGRKTGWSWEAMVNDDLDAFSSAPDRMATAASNTEEKEATGIICDVNGPHASLYTAGFGNIVTDNPPLTEDALETAVELFLSRTDTDGMPIFTGDKMILVVGPALVVTAGQIVNQVQRRITSGDNERIINGNGLPFTIEVVPNFFVPIVATTANAATSWWLFSEPTQRSAGEMAFLRGYEAPQLFRKSPNAQLVGGGSVDPMQGDFDTDSTELKLRHVLGSARFLTTGGHRATVASNGSGIS